jgi:hypothetical protein
MGLTRLGGHSEEGTGHIQKGHGIAFPDFDDDGDQDASSKGRDKTSGGGYSPRRWQLSRFKG